MAKEAAKAANPTAGEKITVGGRIRTLRYTNMAQVRIEEEIGQTLTEALARAAKASLRSIAGLVWAGLLHEEPTLTYAEVVEWIDMKDVASLTDPIINAASLAMGRQIPQAVVGEGESGKE